MEASIAFDNFDGTPLCFEDEAPMILTTVPVAGADGAWTNVAGIDDGANWNNAQINGTTFLPTPRPKTFRTPAKRLRLWVWASAFQRARDTRVGRLAGTRVALVNMTTPSASTPPLVPLRCLSCLGGSNVWTYQWQVNPDSWTDIPSELAFLSPANLTAMRPTASWPRLSVRQRGVWRSGHSGVRPVVPLHDGGDEQ